MEAQNKNFRDVYIIDGMRTPFLKAKGMPGPFSAADLAVSAGKELLGRQPFSPTDLGEVILGCMMPSAEEANIARLVALRLGCGKSMPAWTVQRNCASGMQAIDCGYQDILTGRHDLVLAGGTEAMSRSPLLYNHKMVNWLSHFWSAKTPLSKLKKIIEFRPSFLSPVIALLKGLTDPTVNLSMGQTAEILAHRFHITREQMDAYSVESHKRSAFAEDNHLLSEVTPLYDSTGKYYIADDGVRRDSTIEKLATLKPFFDKTFGNVTAGNSSQITDGSALLLLASKEAVTKFKLPVLARIIGIEWAGLEPSEMGLGPVFATAALMKRYQLSKDEIDYWEINEAFAAQVLSCLAAFDDESFCRENLDLQAPIGKIDINKLNIHGGAIASGHPVGASGARIVLNLVNILKQKNGKRGIATICIGGGQGGSMLIENVSEVSA